jgi:hypothetical protein
MYESRWILFHHPPNILLERLFEVTMSTIADKSPRWANTARFSNDQYCEVMSEPKYPDGSMIILARIKETMIDADNTPIPFLNITSGLIFVDFVNMSASGRIIMTKNIVMCDMS